MCALPILVVLFVAAGSAQANGTEPSDRPNVVFILADDQSYRDFGFLGNGLVYTPNIDRLAARSARYPNGYVPMSVCRPSLATLLTGLYPHQHGIHFNHPPPGLRAMRKMSAPQYRVTRSRTDYLIRNVKTLPRILARHGYVCLQTGKHWEGDYRTAGFTHGMTLARPADRLGPVTGTRKQDNGQKVARARSLGAGRELEVDRPRSRRPPFATGVVRPAAGSARTVESRARPEACSARIEHDGAAGPVVAGDRRPRRHEAVM